MTAVTPARNGRPICGSPDPDQPGRRCTRPPEHPGVHAHFRFGARFPDHTWPADPEPEPDPGRWLATAVPADAPEGRRLAADRARAVLDAYRVLLDLGCGEEVQAASLIADVLILAEANETTVDSVLDLARHHIDLSDE